MNILQASPASKKNRYAGLYIHIPFCERKCLYCDFTSYPAVGAGRDIFVRYLDALLREMDACIPRLHGKTITTIYFGGGTPSLIGAELLGKALLAVRQRYGVIPEAEITVEINPAAITPAFLPSLKEAGFNRVSMGVQSFSDDLLVTLGRIHDSATAIKAFSAVKQAGFGNAGMDLIYGIPGQSPDDWRRSLRSAIDLSPEHISAYCLIHEEGTPMTSLVKAGALATASDELAESMYRMLLDMTEEAGYMRYEVSNFALPGHECRHNLNYWNYGEYLGLGASAHSFMDGRRWSNEERLERYLAGPGARSGAEDGPCDAGDSLKEFLMLGLRKAEGVALEDIRTRWGVEAVPHVLNKGRRFIREGLLVSDDKRLWIADKGLFVMNEVLETFF